MTEKENISSICDTIRQRIQEKHISCFKNSDIPLFLISLEYPGLWLEHVYDSVFYAKLYPGEAQIAKNAINIFMDNQTAERQYPCYYWDCAKANCQPEEAAVWEEKAALVKKQLFQVCYDEADDFFYDVDRYGRKRKYLSSTILHLFQEKVLDMADDRELIHRIYMRHIKNPKEFWTNYPFPSMAVCDPSCRGHRTENCWGYYSQALIALRCTRWMDDYGFAEDLDYICRQWLKAQTACYPQFKLGQELDPFTGKPTHTSEWYSSCMLFYLYSAQRLRIWQSGRS